MISEIFSHPELFFIASRLLLFHQTFLILYQNNINSKCIFNSVCYKNMLKNNNILKILSKSDIKMLKIMKCIKG